MRGSDFYGIQRVLSAHAKVPNPGFFPFSVQHGWQQSPTRYEADGNPLEIWVWSERIRAAIGSFFNADHVRVVGSPYLYLDKLASRPAPIPNRALYLLPHSSHFAKTGFSLEHLKQLLSGIQDENGGCDVLVYYLDVSPQLSAFLRPIGVRMLSNGGLWSSDFLYNFRANILDYRRLYYSTFGSGILFAQHEGLETIHVPLESYLHQSRNDYVNELSATVPFDHQGHQWNCAEELGVPYLLSAAEMRELIRDGVDGTSFRAAQRQLLANLKNRTFDYFRFVRPALRLVDRHNREVARLGRH